jgi:hypothetical protein
MNETLGRQENQTTPQSLPLRRHHHRRGEMMLLWAGARLGQPASQRNNRLISEFWSIGCIFAKVLMGKLLFPGKNVVHHLDLMTYLLGMPSMDTISQV